jgi:predicted dehydrogenase
MTTLGAPLGIGIIGAGNFANFAARCMSAVDGVSVVGVTDPNATAASTLAANCGAKVYGDFDALLADDAVDLIYIATPPSLHHDQSRRALVAGKHVICEKPAALSVGDAEELVGLAAAKGQLYVVNLMQRYNPLYAVVKQIVDEKVLGEFTHGYFENYASDEFLDEGHWFWDDSQSGGIFIEHGVHFFDLFAGWLGRGELVSAAKWRRPGVATELYDRVMAVVNYGAGPVTFYHGFDQPKILDRQEMRLQFERGDITLYGWIPVRITIRGLAKTEVVEQLRTLLPGAQVELLELIRSDGQQSVTGRFKPIEFDHHVLIAHGNDGLKMGVYADLLIRMLTDQSGWIADPHRHRIIDGGNAVESLRIAELATRAAKLL